MRTCVAYYEDSAVSRIFTARQPVVFCMHILHVSKYYPPEKGGLERVVQDIVTGMRERGHSCDVLCANTLSRHREDREENGRIIRCAEWGRVASTSLAPQLVLDYRRIADMYDIIHLHQPNPLATIAALSKQTAARLVVHWHSDIVRQRAALKLYAPFQRRLLERTDAIIATSPPYAAGSPWINRYSSKTHVVPIGIETGHLKTEPTQVDAIKDRFPGRPIVFALGRLTYYKGFEYLIRAARDIPGAWFLIGGEGEERRRLETLVSECEVGDRVILLGDIAHGEIGAYFAACDVFCLPSHIKSEAFGVVQLEAMACAKPLVSTAIPGSGVSWVNRDGESGLVVAPADPDALAGAVNRLLADPALAARLGAGGRARYRAMFTKRDMIEGVARVYEEDRGAGWEASIA